MLDLSSLEKSLAQLAKSYDYCHSSLAQQDHELFLQFRAATIQAFEYTFEICIKMLRRQLEIMADVPTQIEELGYKDLIRTAAEKGFIENPLKWFSFRENRNITSHTYDEEKAEIVYNIMESFIVQAQHLFQQLQEHNS